MEEQLAHKKYPLPRRGVPVKTTILGNHTNRMELKQASKRILIGGALIIWTIKFIVRPLNLFDDPTRFFLNIAPNLLGSFLIPFGAYLFFSGKDFLVARIFRIQSGYDLRLVCVLGFGMLVINEWLQLIPFFGRTFDPNDIYFSSVGLLLAYVVFGRLQYRRTQMSPPVMENDQLL